MRRSTPRLDKVVDALWNLDGQEDRPAWLAFKPDTDDVRFSPALALGRKLHGRGRRRGWL